MLAPVRDVISTNNDVDSAMLACSASASRMPHRCPLPIKDYLVLIVRIKFLARALEVLNDEFDSPCSTLVL